MSGRRDWRRAAACRDEDPDTFFPESTEQYVIAYAKAVCARCPVKDQCRGWADTMDLHDGIYGGATPAERGIPQRQYRVPMT